uniref:tRNA (guanine(26)-N(2))-dimethyltransferase n=1 Tax=Rhabditophanes sp. KR3021 TaxID=114890 RepID=A0AC35TQL6_9BILA
MSMFSQGERCEVVEGKAKLFFDGEKEAFYNPVQEFNRDLTQLVIDREASVVQPTDDGEPVAKKAKHGQHETAPNSGITILDALSASGLRALRFAQEVPNVAGIVANDFSKHAVENIKRNVENNGLSHLITPNYGDAIDCMMQHRSMDKRFHAIDLDPYGSPSIFLDSALQAVADDGLLMVTATDMGVLCGNTPEACYMKYNSIPVKNKACHEIALRMMLKHIDSVANKYGRYITPLLSCSIDFYVRVFVRVKSSAREAKKSVGKLANVLSCSGCHSLSYQPIIKHAKTEAGGERWQAPVLKTTFMNAEGKCSNCESTFHVGGPVYTDPIHDFQFVGRLLQQLSTLDENNKLGTTRRLQGFLTVISEELPDAPLYYLHDQLMNTVRSSVPKHSLINSAILNAGYRVSQTHCASKGIKTDCPLDLLWDIVRKIAADQGVVGDKLSHVVAKNILAKQPTHQINFTLHPKAVAESKKGEMLRFQCNKGKNWGPKQKAKSSINNVNAGFLTKRNDTP